MRRRAGPVGLARSASPSPTAFDPKTVVSRALARGTTSFTRAPSLRRRLRRHAQGRRPRCVLSRPRVPTTPGIPYSRATIAECESRPPLSVTIAPSKREKDVEGLGRRLGDEDVSLDDPTELGGTGDAPRRTFVDAAARRQPAEKVLLVLRLGAPEHLSQSDRSRTHQARHRRRQLGRVRRWRRRANRGVREPPWRCADTRYSDRPASSSADGPPEPVSSAHISSRSASTRCSASYMRPLAARRRPPARTARRMSPGCPDVAVDPTLVPEPVGQSRLCQTARRTRLRCSSGTFWRTSAIRSSRFVATSCSRCNCASDCPQQGVRQLECSRL